MSVDEGEEVRPFSVVVNDEGQYSIWPLDGQPLRGWLAVGAAKSKSECLSDIETLWTDMRPASVARYLDANRTK